MYRWKGRAARSHGAAFWEITNAFLDGLSGRRRCNGLFVWALNAFKCNKTTVYPFAEANAQPVLLFLQHGNLF